MTCQHCGQTTDKLACPCFEQRAAKEALETFLKRFKVGQVPVFTGKQGTKSDGKLQPCLFPSLMMPEKKSLCGKKWQCTKETLKPRYEWILAQAKDYCPECLAVAGIVVE